MADDNNQNQQGNTHGMPAGGQPPQPPQPGAGFPPPPPQYGGFPPPPQGQGGFPPGGAGFPPQPPEDTTPANYQIGNQLPQKINIAIPPHSLKFDEQKFLHLLAGSISLTKNEKKRIIDSIPKLRQEQVDELIRIFEEERRKFAELSEKHVEQLKKLEKQHLADWQDIEMEQAAGQKQQEDAKQADEIRKQLGL